MIFQNTRQHFNFYLDNIVACRPTEEGFRGEENRPPTPPEKEACLPRLQEIVDEIEFQGIVYLGKISTEFKPKTWKGNKTLFAKALELTHPAAILRQEFKLHTIKLQALLLDNYVKTACTHRRESLYR